MDRGVAREGGMGECPPRHGLKEIFSPWIPDRWLPFNWCHMPDVATEAYKRATCISAKENVHYGAPPQTSPPSALRAPRSGPSLPSSCPPAYKKNPGYAPVHGPLLSATVTITLPSHQVSKKTVKEYLENLELHQLQVNSCKITNG